MRTIALIIIYILVSLYEGAVWIGDWRQESTIFFTLPLACFFIHYVWTEIHTTDEDHRTDH